MPNFRNWQALQACSETKQRATTASPIIMISWGWSIVLSLSIDVHVGAWPLAMWRLRWRGYRRWLTVQVLECIGVARNKNKIKKESQNINTNFLNKNFFQGHKHNYKLKNLHAIPTVVGHAKFT